ncbi:MAG: EpsI family protein [Roseibacillus sp.]|nr:EpsI family protein [Roseibacillus sp.]
MITTKHTIVRSVVALLLVSATVGFCMLFPNAAENSASGMVLRLPGREEVPGHLGFERPVSKEEKKWLPEDTGILKMLYVPTALTASNEVEAAEAGISVSLILSGMDRRSLHRPEVCLRAQGWRIAGKETVTLSVAGEDLKVMDFTLLRKVNEKDGTIRNVRAHYVYWWIGAKRSTPSDFERILYTVLDNMFRNVNNRWGYPSVLVYADLKGRKTPAEIAVADAEARRRAFSFIQQNAPLFQKSLGAAEAE